MYNLKNVSLSDVPSQMQRELLLFCKEYSVPCNELNENMT